jgi:hypothetical protein
LLINLQGNYSGANEDRRDGSGIRGQRTNIQLQHEGMDAFQADAPKRLAKQFIALPAMKFVHEILKVAGGRLLVSLQSKQPRDFPIVKFVHL